MILAIDIGNTRIKAGLLLDGKLVFAGVYEKTGFPNNFIREIGGNFDLKDLKYSGLISVGKEAAANINPWLHSLLTPDRVMDISHTTPLPFGSAYETPATLGIDRVAAVAGALQIVRKGPVLIIDAGTAITYEYADKDSVYQGGAIAPGIRLRFKSLNDYTAKLPLIDTDPDFPFVGKSTRESILSGVLNGIVNETQATIDQYRRHAGPDLKVFLTGGDAEFLGNHLKNVNFVDPNLLLTGVGAILQYNIHA